MQSFFFRNTMQALDPSDFVWTNNNKTFFLNIFFFLLRLNDYILNNKAVNKEMQLLCGLSL